MGESLRPATLAQLRRVATSRVLTFEVSDAAMFAAMLSAGRVIPLNTKPLPFGAFHFPYVADSA